MAVHGSSALQRYRTWLRRAGALRISPNRLAWLLLTGGVLGCLLSACGTQRENAFAEPPSPDLAVTTLTPADIDLVATVVQIQETIRLGHLAAGPQELPASVQELAELIDLQRQSRARDLAQLIRVKHAPVPAELGQGHRALLDRLSTREPKDVPAGFLSFHSEIQRELMRVLRDGADRSEDPDVRAFAQRQLPAVASLLRRIDQQSHS